MAPELDDVPAFDDVSGEATKRCPARFSVATENAEHLHPYCLGTDCAWYDAELRQCAVRSILYYLARLDDRSQR